MTAAALCNGRPVAAVPVTDRGLAYGDGLFETIRVCGGRPQFLPLHLQRLRDGCARLRIELNDLALAAEIAQLLRGRGDGVLKLIVTRAASGRGYQPGRGDANRLLLFHEGLPKADAEPGIRVRVCRQRLAEQPVLAGLKHLNRLEQVLARAEWSDPAVAEGLMLDQRDRLVEATASNVFLVRGGRLLTPRLHRCGVAGIVRRVVMERLAPGRVEACDLTLGDVHAADEIFLTNSLFGIRPVLQVECLLKVCGDVTIDLRSRLSQLIAYENR